MQTALDKPRIHPIVHCVITLALVFIGLQIIGPFIGFFIASVFYPEPMTDMVQHLEHPMDYPALKTPFLIMQGVGELVGLFVMPWYLLRRQGEGINAFLSRPVYLQMVGLMALIVFSFLVVDSQIVIWNENLDFPEWMSSFEQWARNFEDSLKKLTVFVTTFDSVGSFIVGFIVIAVLPAIGEEFVFRGVVQRDLLRGTGNVHVAIWVTAILFSAFHFQFFGFFPRMLLGALFGYLYHWSGSLVMPILAHFLNNGLIVVSLYLYQRGYLDVDMENPEAAPWAAVGVSLVALIALMIVYKRFFDQRPLPVTEVGQQNLPHSHE